MSVPSYLSYVKSLWALTVEKFYLSAAELLGMACCGREAGVYQSYLMYQPCPYQPYLMYQPYATVRFALSPPSRHRHLQHALIQHPAIAVMPWLWVEDESCLLYVMPWLCVEDADYSVASRATWLALCVWGARLWGLIWQLWGCLWCGSGECRFWHAPSGGGGESDQRRLLPWRHSSGTICSNVSNLEEAVDKDGETVLMKAAMYGDVEIARELLGVGVNVNASANNGATSLFIAVCSGSVEFVTLLLNHRCDISIANKQQQTALWMAARLGWVLSITLLKHIVALFYLISVYMCIGVGTRYEWVLGYQILKIHSVYWIAGFTLGISTKHIYRALCTVLFVLI